MNDYPAHMRPNRHCISHLFGLSALDRLRTVFLSDESVDEIEYEPGTREAAESNRHHDPGPAEQFVWERFESSDRVHINTADIE